MLAWRVLITLEAEFCLEAVGEAPAWRGKPGIFDTDQGSKFTSAAVTSLLLDNKIAISMDGRGAWRDNVFVERLWRSIKYEEVYLWAYDTVAKARMALGRYLEFYNHKRPYEIRRHCWGHRGGTALHVRAELECPGQAPDTVDTPSEGDIFNRLAHRNSDSPGR